VKKLTLTLIGIAALLVISSEAGAWQSNISDTINGNDQALAVTVDAANNVIAAGFTRNSGTLDDFTIIKFSGRDGTELWRRVISGTATADDRALAVTVDTAGNVIAAGFITNNNTGRDFTVFKFNGSNGTERWRQVINGTANGNDQALAVTAGGAGNVIAAGFTTNSGTGSDFTVIKFDGNTGTELWRRVINGNANGADHALAITVGGAGNVIAAGYTTSSNTGSDFTVFKFNGSNGAELWRRVINGTRNDIDEALGVAVGRGGNVVAAGYTTNTNTNRDFTVIKFNGNTGTELWRQLIGGSSRGLEAPNAVTLDDAGDVVVAGHIDTDFADSTSSNFTVIKLNGAKGSELWRHPIGNFNASGVANAISLDGARNVIAAGFTTNPGTGSDFTVIKFDGASGIELWRRVINGTANGEDQALAVKADADGNVVAAGFARNSDTFDDFTVIKLSGVDGGGLWSHVLNTDTTDACETAPLSW
jgi:hypothetical protein